MQWKLEKRMAHGVTALVSYTVSKNINDIANPQDNYNRQAERALSEFDVPQRLTVTAAWDLPLGRGKRLFRGVSPRLNLFLGGCRFHVRYVSVRVSAQLRLGAIQVFADGAAQRPASRATPPPV